MEINRKFKHLAKRNNSDQATTLKDYNVLVETIMSLTGSYNSKSKIQDSAPSLQSQYQNLLTSQRNQIFNFFPQQSFDSKVLYSEGPLSIGVEKGFSRQMTIESTDSQALKSQIPFSGFSRQSSFSQFLTNFTGLKRQDSYELNDKGNKKKIKWETPPGDSQETDDLNKENPTLKQNDSGGGGNQNDGEEFLNLNLPTFRKKASNISQPPDELPSLTRFNSNLSFLYDNK